MNRLKTIGLMLLFLILAYAIVMALAAWAELEAAKSDDKFYVRTGYEVSKPVLEVR